MKSTLTLLAALLSLCLLSCEKETIRGNGPIQEEFRSLQNFTKVSTSGATDVTVEPGSTFEVKLSGYSNLLPHFETWVVNGELRLGYRNGVSVRNDNLKVHVVMPELAGLNISGSSTIDVNGAFPQVPQFDCNISGSGKIFIENLIATDFDADISGSGEILAFGLRCFNADIDISGSGITETFIQDHLRARISGSGTIYYRGNPTVSSTISGNGRVIPQ